MRIRSFRARLLIGSLLWTAGLLSLMHMLSMMLVIALPGMRSRPHHLMVILGVTFALTGLAIVRGSLTHLTRLRARLGDVHEGRAQRVEGEYLTEITPLVDDLNALLAHRERVVRRALTTAADLAHGLKTPLAILAQEAERAEAAGQHELAATITQQVERMRRQTDYHLAHARAAGSGASQGARSHVRVAAERLARTMLRLHDRVIAIDVAEDLVARCELEDLEEMLG
ncbi:MAG TPA: hypothetical protein VF608_12510, partial [Thermoanaerobaculia bacterium]